MVEINNLFNNLKNPLFGKSAEGNSSQSAIHANPFQSNAQLSGTPDVNPIKAASAPRFNGLSEIQEVGSRGSAFSADGGIGRVVPGGMQTPIGQAGQRLQLFA